MTTKLQISYRQIISLSLPLILGSAGQNIIALSDSIFLYYKSKTDFATIGFIGVFYLVIAAIGYGFSKGGQILIARRMGEGKPEEVGRNFFDMLYFELMLALIMFLFMRYGCPHFFKWFVKSKEIYDKSLIFLRYRSWGVFFSYAGLALISLYTGVARTKFILIDTVIMGILNMILCYVFVFGKFGFPEMGIGGAALASSLAEAFAFVCFVIYIFFDKKADIYHLFTPRKMHINAIREQLKISLPSIAQPVVGIGSWFLFFSYIEIYLDVNALAITNLVRLLYLFFSIPSWGFASCVNTLVSNVIGQNDFDNVIPTIWKTAKLCLVVTLSLAVPALLFPDIILKPMFSRTGEADLLLEAQPIFVVLLIILTIFSIGAVFFNALAGLGAAFFGLFLQFIGAVVYLVFIHTVLTYTTGGLAWAWSAEIFYWIIILGATLWYLYSNRWRRKFA